MQSKVDSFGTSYSLSKINEKNPIVFIHGVGLSKEIWEPQINFFKDYFRVITPDLPGFGKSNKAKPQNNIQSIANLLLDCLHEKKNC